MLKHFQIAGLFIMIASGCSGSSNDHTSSPMTQKQAQAIFDRYAELWSAEDLDGWLSLWADNGVVQMPFDEPRVVGQDELRSRNAAALENADFVASITNLDVDSDGDLAYASGVYTMEITPADGSQPWTLDAKYLSVFKRQANGEWKLIRDAFSSNVPLN